MNTVLSNNTIKKVLSHNDTPSADSVMDALFEELDKSADKTDINFVNACLDRLLETEGIVPCGVSAELPVELKTIERERFAWQRRAFLPKGLKFAVAACFTFVILFFVNTISTYAFGFNITSEFATWTKDKVSIRFTTEESGNLDSQAVFEQIQGQLLSNGLLHVQWPEYLPQKMDLSSITVNDGETTTNVTICLVDGKDNLSINLAEYKDQKYIDEQIEVDILGYYTDGEVLTIGDRTVYYLANKNRSVMCYADGLSRYVITSTYDKETLTDIVESMS